MPTVGEIVKKTTTFFQEKGMPSARLDSELLIARALGWERLQVFLKFDYPLSDDEVEKCRDFVRRRSKGEPVAYILGEKGFYEHSFEVTPATLIPRPETEMLVERAIGYLRPRTITESGSQTAEYLVVDLGCGSGCIGLSIAAAIPWTKVILVDISDEALAVAGRNAVKLGVADRCQFRLGDAGSLDSEIASPFTDLIEKADIVVANPPYIDPADGRVEPGVRQFEPATALFAGQPGEEGLEEIRRWSKVARHLAAGSSCTLFEIGDGQGAQAAEIFRITGWGNVEVAKDLSDRERMVVAISSPK